MMIRALFLASLLLLGPLYGDTEKNSTCCFPVGELGKEWEFMSDHLPIGVSVDGHHFVSWNILDTQYLQWIEKDTQGLKKSAIIRDNVPSKTFSRLTLREENIIYQILEMVHHQTHPRSLLAFQETSEAMLETLKEVLPTTFVPIVLPSSHGDVFFFDSSQFEKVTLRGCSYKDSHNTWMSLTLRDRKTGQLYTMIQSHVPGGEHSMKAREELAAIVLRDLNPESITLIMGDQNRSPDQFLKNLETCSQKKGWQGQPFQILQIPYPTHVNTLKEASWIDNLFIAGPTYKLKGVKVDGTFQEFFSDLELPITIMWEKYALDDLIKCARNALPQDPNVLRGFNELLDEVRPFFLMHEMDLERFLNAVILMANQYDRASGSHSLKTAKMLWEKGEIRNANTLIASLVQNPKISLSEIKQECGERVAKIVQERPTAAREDFTKIRELSLEARLILLADVILQVQDGNLEVGPDFLHAIKGTNEALEHELSL